ncbi:cellulose binding domain-containing protein [Streptomyces griseofuscus]|uniref:cellulose binding domain-containing protein n=1 Tax=Streptomyces griseofuscus TaxID=146922 RepID=UPI0036BFB48A
MGGERGDQLGIGAVGAQQSEGLFDGGEPGPAAGDGAEGPADAPGGTGIRSGSVAVKNNGSAAINGWTVKLTFPGNQTVSSLWNGSYTQSGNTVAVKNASNNGSLGAGAATSFGFNANYSGSNGAPTATCTTG